MGYVYDVGFDGKQRLCCDRCGKPGGVRKRPCTFKVGDLPYCPAPALCSPCFVAEGKSAGLHARCEEGAKDAQAREARKQEALDRGDYLLRAGFGSWHDTVPKGFVGALFVNKDGDQQTWLIPEASYAKRGEWPRPVDLTGARPYPELKEAI